MGHAVRTLGQYQASAIGVDKPKVVVALAAECKRLDAAGRVCTDNDARDAIHQERVQVRYALRQAEADALSAEDWANIDLALAAMGVT